MAERVMAVNQAPVVHDLMTKSPCEFMISL